MSSLQREEVHFISGIAAASVKALPAGTGGVLRTRCVE